MLSASIENSSLFDFAKLWSQVKDKISDILSHGARLWNLRNEYLDIEVRAENIGRYDIVDKARKWRSKVTSLFMEWREMKDKIVKFLPFWKEKSKESGLGGIVTTVMILAALSAVSVYAFKYMKEYLEVTNPLQALREELITAEQYVGIERDEGGFFSKMENIGVLLAFAVGGAVLISLVRKES